LASLLALASPPARALTIISTFDSSITGDPNAATIISSIDAAVQVYETNFTDPITVKITFKEGGGLGSSSTFYFNDVNYLSFMTALSSHATTANDATALAHLSPFTANNPVDGNTTISLTTANAKALGLFSYSGTDGTITLNTSLMNLDRVTIDPAKYDLQAVAEHEIDEVLGTASGLGSNEIQPVDLYRYDSSGARNYTTSGDNAYFSLDGTTLLARYNQHTGADYGDWYSFNGGQTPRVQDAYGTPGVIPAYGEELTLLDVVGYTFSPVPEPGATSLLMAGMALAGAGVSRRMRRR